MNMNSLKLVLFPFLALGSVACTVKYSDDSDRPRQREVEDSDTDESGDENGGAPAYGGASGEDVGPYTVFEDFEIPINQTITVGSFDVHLVSALVRSGKDSTKAPSLKFTFLADNLDDAVQRPLWNAVRYDGILEIAGQHFDAWLSEEVEVPGFRTGENSVWWSIEDPEITPEQIKTGVITFGAPSANKAIIPLAHPEDTITLNDIPLSPMEISGIQANHTLDLDNPHIRFNNRNDNRTLKDGTAWLVLSGTLFGGDDHSCVNADYAYVTAPSGLSTVAFSGHNCVDSMETEDFQLVFELKQPIAGTYEVTLEDDIFLKGDVDTTFEITIPE